MSDKSGLDDETTATVVEPELASAEVTHRGRRPVLAPGTDWGRYRLLHEVGTGGMGVVMAAFDQELDRMVALKVLRPHRNASGEGRMRTEARALAQLQHPSVVTVFEVGTHDGFLFIAMEFIDGETLDRWAAHRRRDWSAIVDVAEQAGRGLAAAHAVGIVHRDIKPSNILVGKDGRVCVADFGIATAVAPNPADEVAPEPAWGDSSRRGPGRRASPSGGWRSTASVSGGWRSAASVSGDWRETASHAELEGDTLVVPEARNEPTQEGTVVGTPAFMAPEQHDGRSVDARSDQFAFCVSLYRVLYDDAPFVGDDLESLRASVREGQVRPAPAGTTVPSAVRRVLLRGLSVDPDRRWPSVAALLDALRRVRHRRRRLGVGLAIGVTAAAVGGVALWPEQPTGCVPAEERLAGVWDATRSAAVSQAFSATDLPYSADALARTTQRLDRYAEQWRGHYEALCSVANAAEAAPTMDLEMGCLSQRREELLALVDLLEEADAEVIAKATEAAAGLEPVGACRARGAAAAAMASPPTAVHGQVESVRGLLARARAAERTGLFVSGIERAQQARARAEDLGYLPLEVESLLVLGRLESLAGRLDDAERHLGDAAVLGVEARHDRVAAEAATLQAFVVGYRQGRREEGQVWLRHATAALERLGPEPLVDADFRMTRAALHSAAGEHEVALVDFRHGLAERISVYGEDHPTIGGAYNNIGGALVSLGRYEEALTALERAQSIWDNSIGPDHPSAATAHNGVGVVLEELGRWEEARDRYRRALEIREQAFGPNDVSLALALDNLGSVLNRLGEYEQARRASQRALELREATLGPGHPHYASALVNLGLIAENQQQLDRAAKLQRRAITLWEESLGPEHAFLGYPLTSLGRVELQLGNGEHARTLLRRAMSIREAEAKDYERATTRLALADALWEIDATEARKLAQRALTEAPGDTRNEAILREQIEAWLAGHPTAR